jgi:hypothetical protein
MNLKTKLKLRMEELRKAQSLMTNRNTPAKARTKIQTKASQRADLAELSTHPGSSTNHYLDMVKASLASHTGCRLLDSGRTLTQGIRHKTSSNTANATAILNPTAMMSKSEYLRINNAPTGVSPA